MSGDREALLAHLAGGVTTTCRTWGLERADGVRLGFTDHDRDLAFDGWTFRAGTGLTSGMLSQGTGLSVDNTEAEGALTSDALNEADIAAGRFDNASVVSWLVNWQETAQRIVLFRGTLGEIVRSGGAFRADLRGLTEELNQPRERVYQRPCAAILGDTGCGVNLSASAYSEEAQVVTADGGRRFTFGGLSGFDPEWFERGRLVVLSGSGTGLTGQIKLDRKVSGTREIELWQELRAEVAPGDTVRVEAGCDKRITTCRAKFNNAINFRGFPHIPGDDWVTNYPRAGQLHDGGSYLRLPSDDA